MNLPRSAELTVVKNLPDAVLADKLDQQLRLEGHIGAVKDIVIQQQRVAVPAANMRGANQLQCNFRERV